MAAKKNYLVLETGYEGITKIFGTFTAQKALEVIRQKKKVARKAAKVRKDYDELSEKLYAIAFKRFGTDSSKWPSNIDDHTHKHPILENFREKYFDLLMECDNPDFYCVVTVTPEGTKCVCGELNVKPTKLMLR